MNLCAGLKEGIEVAIHTVREREELRRGETGGGETGEIEDGGSGTDATGACAQEGDKQDWEDNGDDTRGEIREEEAK